MALKLAPLCVAVVRTAEQSMAVEGCVAAATMLQWGSCKRIGTNSRISNFLMQFVSNIMVAYMMTPCVFVYAALEDACNANCCTNSLIRRFHVAL